MTSDEIAELLPTVAALTDKILYYWGKGKALL